MDDSLSEDYLATDWIPSQALQCPYYVPLSGRLGADWGVIVNPESRRFGLLTFEHDDCGWPPAATTGIGTRPSRDGDIWWTGWVPNGARDERRGASPAAVRDLVQIRRRGVGRGSARRRPCGRSGGPVEGRLDVPGSERANGHWGACRCWPSALRSKRKRRDGRNQREPAIEAQRPPGYRRGTTASDLGPDRRSRPPHRLPGIERDGRRAGREDPCPMLASSPASRPECRAARRRHRRATGSSPLRGR